MRCLRGAMRVVIKPGDPGGNMRKLMLAGLASIGLLGFELPADAQSDCKTLVQASPFGPDDQTGATNRAPGAALGKNGLTYMEDTWLSQSHVGTHLDGLGHIGRLDCYYNQTPMGKYINQNNMTRLGLEHLKSFATRGVIIDLVKVFQNAGKLKSNPACRNPCIDKGTVITTEDLQAGLKMYNVTLREADVVFLHTGWVDLFEQYPAQNTLYNSGEPGLGVDAANWLASQKVVAVGADTWAVEVIPPEDPSIIFPVHQTLITNNGIHIIENVKTDDIAAEAAATGRATFFLNMTVPKAVGLTGNFVGIEAIR